MNTIGGASGDMLIASLIDSGLSIDDLKSQLNLLDVGGFELSVARDKRAGMVGTHVDVDLDREGAEIRGISNFVNVVENSGISESAKKIVNTPKSHFYSKLYYKNKWFKNSVPVQFGVNVYYRSKYFGNGYEPILQSYFVQNSFELENNLRYNLFFSMQVNNLRLFLKMTHFNQFDRYDGYFVTPFYPAQKKVLDLGLKWYFFN